MLYLIKKSYDMTTRNGPTMVRKELTHVSLKLNEIFGFGIPIA